MTTSPFSLSTETAARAFEEAPLPAIVLYADGALAGTNAAAGCLIDRGVLGLDAARRLSVGDPRENLRLGNILDFARAGGRPQGFALRVADGRARGIDVRPLSNGQLLLCVRTLVADREPCLATLADIYGLTPAEVRVLSELINGASPKAAADQLQISLNTVRTHIRSLLWKCSEPNLTRLVSHVIEIC